jgi:hypothetical protein
MLDKTPLMRLSNMRRYICFIICLFNNGRQNQVREHCTPAVLFYSIFFLSAKSDQSCPATTGFQWHVGANDPFCRWWSAVSSVEAARCGKMNDCQTICAKTHSDLIIKSECRALFSHDAVLFAG